MGHKVAQFDCCDHKQLNIIFSLPYAKMYTYRYDSATPLEISFD